MKYAKNKKLIFRILSVCLSKPTDLLQLTTKMVKTE